MGVDEGMKKKSQKCLECGVKSERGKSQHESRDTFFSSQTLPPILKGRHVKHYKKNCPSAAVVPAATWGANYKIVFF